MSSSRSFLFFVAATASTLAAQSPQPKMGAPLNGLTAAQLQRFQAGRVDFTQVFQASQGLGPIFNQTSCGSCHNNPVGGPGGQFVTRFGFTDGKGNFDPLEALGGSLLQANAINLACQEVVPGIANTTAQRITTSALGMGLIEAIADAAIAARETSPPSPHVSGRVHWVQPLETPTGPLRAGRFGWKAQVATTLTFSGDAAQNELGFSNRLVPFDNAPNGNLVLLAQWDSVPDPEDGPDAQGNHFIDRVTDFQRFLAAPPQTPRSGMTGAAIFQNVGCADCHTVSFVTQNDPSLEAAIRNKVIRPYSDFLVHDMGIAADFIVQGDVNGQELRTPPLWGLRTRDPLWHDGRIVGGTLQSRVLGPGGVIDQHAAFGSEALPSATAFQALSQADQLKVVAFLDSLGRREFDANGDDVLDQTDLAAFLAARGGAYSPDAPQAVFDFDQNGWVDNQDLVAFAQVYEVDCNGNGTNDLQDVISGFSADANENYVPDECEFCQPDLGYAGAGTLALRVCGDPVVTTGARATFEVTGGQPDGPLVVAIGFATNPYLITPTEYLVPLEPLGAVVDTFLLDGTGKKRAVIQSGPFGPPMTFVLQAATFSGTVWDLSNGVEILFTHW
jgi:CxxC motif-containing protein (DUF1111 family)